VIGDTVFVAPGHWARQPFKGIVLDDAGRTVRGAILTWTVTSRLDPSESSPRTTPNEEAVTLNTAEDGGITVWRKSSVSCTDPDAPPDRCVNIGDWIGATLSIERYPDVTPITLDALVRL
jgi:hypothetical protein